MTDHDAEMDATLELFEGAGRVQVYVNAAGKPAMRLTDGERLARLMAMSADPDTVLDALLRRSGIGRGPALWDEAQRRADRAIPHPVPHRAERRCLRY